MEYKTPIAISLLLSSVLAYAEPDVQLSTEESQNTDSQSEQIPAEDQGNTVESVTPYNRFVTEELFVFLHSGGSNRYRIIGRIAASEEVKIIARDTESGWLQVELNNGRQGWVDNAVLVETAGTKALLASANEKITALETRIRSLDNGSEATIEQLNSQLEQQTAELNQKNQSNNELQSLVEQLTKKNTELENSIVQTDQTQKILDKLYDVGAVLIGVFAGWLITRRRKSSLSFDRL